MPIGLGNMVAKQFIVGAIPQSQRYLGALGASRYVGKDYASEWAG